MFNLFLVGFFRSKTFTKRIKKIQPPPKKSSVQPSYHECTSPKSPNPQKAIMTLAIKKPTSCGNFYRETTHFHLWWNPPSWQAIDAFGQVDTIDVHLDFSALEEGIRLDNSEHPRGVDVCILSEKCDFMMFDGNFRVHSQFFGVWPIMLFCEFTLFNTVRDVFLAKGKNTAGIQVFWKRKIKIIQITVI